VLSRIPMHLSAFVAFADDLAATLFKLHKSLRLLAPLFQELAQATGLIINMKKTVIIPIAGSTTFSVKRFLVDCLPGWSRVIIADAGKLLGVRIGRCTDEERWQETAAKYRTRAAESKATGFSIAETVRHYQVHAFSVISHLAQYCNAPAAILAAEDYALQGLARGPHNVFTRRSLASLGIWA
jgi:hypothetical protein